jgi:hypothetical protein
MVGAAVMRRVRSSGPALAEREEADAAEPRQSYENPRNRAASMPALAASNKICPTCGSMYGTEAGFCGNDGTFLVRAN